MVTEFAALILYTQLTVATPAGATVALRWTDEEVAQGFAWDPAVVAFGVPDHDGRCLVRVDTAPLDAAAVVADDALWAIAVPFEAREATIMVGSLADGRDVAIAPGRYRLVFQARPAPSGYAYRLHLSFIPHASPGFAILRQGELASGRVLRPRSGRS